MANPAVLGGRAVIVLIRPLTGFNFMHTCEVCGRTGNAGAKWLVVVKGDKNPPKRVHKPCGEGVVERVPEGVSAKVEPSSELRAEWKAKRNEAQARDFWGAKFAEAEARRKLEVVLAAEAV